MISPTQRALALCRKLGFACAIVERWNPHAKIRQDLFGFADLLLLSSYECHVFFNGEVEKPSDIPILKGIYAIQVTSGSNHAARRTKILAEYRAKRWLWCGGMIEVWSFAKKGPRGKRKTWNLRRDPVRYEEFA